MYFSGQGKLMVAPWVNGVVGEFRWVGNVNDFKLQFNSKTKEHKESYSGKRGLDKILVEENVTKVSADLEDWSKENLAMAVRGKSFAKASGTVAVGAPESSSATLVAGSIWALKNQKVSGVTIKDSAATTVTVNPLHVRVDADFGTITLLDASTYVMPLKASYTYAAADSIAFFTQPTLEVALRFEGINTADGDKKVLAEVYRVSIDPAKELGLITDNFGKFQIDGRALLDSSVPDSDQEFGQFGRIVYL